MGNAFYIVEIDRVKYSSAARAAKALLGAEGLDLLNKKTQSYIDFGLNAVGLLRDESFVLEPRGDDAIIFFDAAVLVHNFAKAVYEHTQNVNATVEPEYRCWFRIGCSYDPDIILKDNKLGSNPASYGLAIANRLRKKAEPGEILIDPKTYTDLPIELKQKYGSEEKIQEKDHDEAFACHRWLVIPNVGRKLIAESEDIKKKKLENDFEICKKKLLAEPENPDLLNEMILLAIKLQKIEEVESTVDQASLIAPKQYGIWVLKGDFFFDLKLYKKAISSYCKAVEIGLGSKDYKVWLKLGRSYFWIENYTHAADLYQQALAHCHDSLNKYLIYHEYGVVLDKLNLHHESIKAYNVSLHLQANYRFSSYARKCSYRKIYS
jgi:hypothetical protein